MLSAAGAVLAIGLPANAQPTPPDEVVVHGIVRDFRMTDPDFTAAPAQGLGHSAGNLGLTLGPSLRPVYTGTGFMVDSEWRDGATNPIAPHLFSSGFAGVVSLVNPPQFLSSSLSDTYSAADGPYGTGPIGPPPTFESGSTMPAVPDPPLGLPTLGSVTYETPGTTIINQSRQYTNLTIKNGHRVRITGGHHTIVVTGTLTIRDENTILEIEDGSRLTMFLYGPVVIRDMAVVNPDTSAPSKLVIWRIGSAQFLAQDDVSICAILYAPDATLACYDDVHFYGMFTGASMFFEDDCFFHADTSGAVMVCGAPLNDTIGVAGVGSTSGIPGAAAFNAWYYDVLGVNLSGVHSITLTLNGAGIYEYHNPAFYPIDGQLFGNEGQDHNYYFTYTFNVNFIHHACQNTFVQFEGSDDAWLFIDGELVLDIGGVVPGTPQRIDVDRLNLVDGQIYRIDFFYAQRQTDYAGFHLQTNVDLLAAPTLLAVSAGHD